MEDHVIDPVAQAEEQKLNKRRYDLYRRLLADQEFQFFEIGRLDEVVRDEESKVLSEQDPVKLLAARDRWKLARENRRHFDQVLRNYEAAQKRKAEDIERQKKGLPPAAEEE